MGLLKTHLWKEWREHRGICLAVALAFPVLTLLVELVTMKLPSHGSVPVFAALAAFGTVAFALFGEAFAGEERRDGLAFLRRQPGGWAPPFFAKHLFLLLASTAITSWVYATAALLTWIFHRVGPDPICTASLEVWIELLLLVPLWSIAVSIAFPRSTIALPAAAFVLLVLFAPVLVACAVARGGWAYVEEPENGFRAMLAVLRASGGTLEWVLRLLVGAAPVVAALAFARGRMVERGRWRAALVGSVATLALFTPGYAWTAGRIVDFLEFDARAPTLRIASHGAVSTNGRFAYFNVWNAASDGAIRFCAPGPEDHPYHALRFDLANGKWKDLAPAGTRVWPLRGDLLSGNASLVVLEDSSSRSTPARVGDEAPERSGPLALVDADSGEMAQRGIGSLIRLNDGTSIELRRSFGTVDLPTGARAWIEDGHVVLRDHDGATRVLPDSKIESNQNMLVQERGFGLWVGMNVYYDVSRERRFAVPELLFPAWIRGGAWIVRKISESSKLPDPEWNRPVRWDPETHESSPIPGLVSNASVLEWVGGMAGDGRLFVVTVARPKSEPRAPRLWLLDPDTGVREEIELPPRLREWKSLGLWPIGRTPSGALVMNISDRSADRFVYGRFDLATRRFKLADLGLETPTDLFGCVDESTILVTDGQRVLRASFDRPGVEVLFPR